MRDAYADQLGALSNDVVTLARLVRVAVTRATTALLVPDPRSGERILAGDATIDALRDRIEERSFELLSLQNPVAGDLRMLIATMRIVGDLERVGDLAVHVAKVAQLRAPDRALPESAVPMIERMANLAAQMVGRVEHVIADSDLDAARELERIDDEVDELRRESFRTILGSDWAHGVEAAVDVALLGRYYERMADHAVSVARRVIFLVTGKPLLRS